MSYLPIKPLAQFFLGLDLFPSHWEICGVSATGDAYPQPETWESTSWDLGVKVPLVPGILALVCLGLRSLRLW